MKGTTNINAVVARSCETSNTEKDRRPASSDPDAFAEGVTSSLLSPDDNLPMPNREILTY